ncbi:transcription factor PAR2-like [Mangifera indica]|uniref:transcription factor PAR2-like n=1 Tax=Mangifera indica TaxID=29780 RepID=UPI001CFAC3B8|nr:transcription factor PAR2-like [Mangifera indica]
MEQALSSTISIPTFRRSERKTKAKTHMKSETYSRCRKRGEINTSSSSFQRMKRIDTKVHDKVSGTSEEEEEEDEGEKGEVERKIVALQRIVPGGESLGVDKLFEETAEYILALQCQIKAMKALASFIQGLEKEKRKFGG